MAMVAICGTMAFAGTQVDKRTYTVPVTITVSHAASIWAADPATLVLDLKNAENSDAVASTITHINNVGADISVAVAGSLTDVNFFIFDGGTTAAAVAAMHASPSAPAGCIAFTLNGPAVPFVSVAKARDPASRTIIYAADAPTSLPDPGDMNLVVTWTIAIAP